MMFFVASETTIKKLNQKEAFRAVDLEAPLLLAKFRKNRSPKIYFGFIARRE